MHELTGVPAIFGSDVFSESVMKSRLAPEIFEAWRSCIDDGSQLPLRIANEIAEAMKTWAIEKGATHYTHWFQPMTGKDQNRTRICPSRVRFSSKQKGKIALFSQRDLFFAVFD